MAVEATPAYYYAAPDIQPYRSGSVNGSRARLLKLTGIPEFVNN